MDLNICFADFASFREWEENDDKALRENYQNKILKKWRESNYGEMKIWGWCDVCARETHFLLDGLYSDQQNPLRYPNWRERLVCLNCNLNARMRATFSILPTLLAQESRMWINEQTTTFYQCALKRYPNLIGSEYLGKGIKSGDVMENGIRHEDCTATSHENSSLDGVLSFDVMEHIPNYRAAISETFRVLRNGGTFFWSAPFDKNVFETSVRSNILEDGAIQHNLPPIWHGDPMNPSEGILCYQIFGWDILDLLRSSGFKEAKVVFFWSKSRGALGNPLPFFIAKK